MADMLNQLHAKTFSMQVAHDKIDVEDALLVSTAPINRVS